MKFFLSANFVFLWSIILLNSNANATEDGYCSVKSYVDGTASLLYSNNRPPVSLVDARSKSTCIVNITYPNGIISQQTGVLIDNDKVVTAMHGFMKSGSTSNDHGTFILLANKAPDVNLNNVKVCFNYLSGSTTDLTNWINVIKLSPTPPLNCTEVPVWKDFIVLQLHNTGDGGQVTI